MKSLVSNSVSPKEGELPSRLEFSSESEKTEFIERMLRVLKVLALAVEGQNEKFDELVGSLKDQLETGMPAPLTLDQLSVASQDLTIVRKQRAEKFMQGIHASLAQLLKLDVSPEQEKNIKQLMTATKRVASQPDQQALLPLRLAKIQQEIFKSYNPVAENKKPSLREEGNVDPQDFDIEALFEDDSLDDLPPYSSVAETIDNILIELLSKIRVPESVSDEIDRARSLLSEGLDWYQFTSLLDTVSYVVIESLSKDNREFEKFLLELNRKLGGVNKGVESVNDSANALIACGDSLELDVRRGLDAISCEIDQYSDGDQFDGLRHLVKEELDQLFGKLDDSKWSRQKFKKEYEERIEDLQDQVTSLEYQLVEAQEELLEQQKRSEVDKLTELPNRAAYDKRIDLELERWRRHQQSFCLVVGDVDHFKQVNDTYGHLAGDKVLRVIAKLLRKRLRRIDFIARYGGEEFVMLLPSTDLESAKVLVERLGFEIADCPFHYQGNPLKVTLSFGLTEVAKNDDVESIFKRSDDALYNAKAAGRNCTRIIEA